MCVCANPEDTHRYQKKHPKLHWTTPAKMPIILRPKAKSLLEAMKQLNERYIEKNSGRKPIYTLWMKLC